MKRRSLVVCMDGREGLAMSGPASYYMHRGIGGPGVGSQQPGLHGPPPGIRSMPNPGSSLPSQSSGMGTGAGPVGSAAFQVEPSPVISPLGGGGVGSGGHMGVGSGEPMKRKRGRPRKYGLDGTMALALSPLSSATPPVSGLGSGSVAPTPRRGRGRPPGTGRKQQLALLGELRKFFSLWVFKREKYLIFIIVIDASCLLVQIIMIFFCKFRAFMIY